MMKRIIKKILFLIIHIIILNTIILCADIDIKLSGDTDNEKIEIKNKSEVLVGSITAAGNAFFKDVYIKEQLDAASISLSSKAIINNQIITSNKINNWNSIFDLVVSSNSEWTAGYEKIVSSYTAWNEMYSIVNSSHNSWTNAYNVIVASNSNWHSAYNIVNTNYNNWEDAYTAVSLYVLRNDQDDRTTIKLKADGGFETVAGVKAGIGNFSGKIKAASLDTGYGAFEIGYNALKTGSVEFASIKANSIKAKNTGLLFEDRIGTGYMFIEGTSGNLGLGTTEPKAKLHVLGGDNATGSNNRASIALSYIDGPNYRHWIRTRHNAGTGKDNAIEFYTCDKTADGSFPANAVHGLTIEDGKVGIGTDDPKDKLEIYEGSTYYYAAPIGAILPFAGYEVPTGWLECNGQELNASDYPKLKDAFYNSSTYQYIHGGSPGSGKFFLPDLRGRFLRGRTDGNDSIGKDGLKDEQLRRHAHYAGTLAVSAAGLHRHKFWLDDENAAPGSKSGPDEDSGGYHGPYTSTEGGSNHYHIIGGELGYSGGPETRPKNACVKFIIKAN